MALAVCFLRGGVPFIGTARAQVAQITELESELDQLHQERGNNFQGDDARAVLARRILAIDSTSGIANLALAVIYEKRFLQKAALQRRRPNRPLLRQVRRNENRTRDYFERALRGNPQRESTYRDFVAFLVRTRRFARMAELTATMRGQLPEERSTWLFSGVAALNANMPDSAARYFERALSTMPPQQREEYLLAELILRPGEQTARGTDEWERYWEIRRPRRLTEANERRLAHYERIVLSDLLYPYWREYQDDNWQFTPADVLLRYGLPLSESSWLSSDAITRELALSYPHHTFRFRDWTRNGEFLIYSTAEDLAGDPVTAARDTFKSTPEYYALPSGVEMAKVVYLATQFRATEPSGSPVPFLENSLVVSAGALLPDQHGSLNSDHTGRTGAFALSAGGKTLDQDITHFERPTESQFVFTPSGRALCYTHVLNPPSTASRVSVEFELTNEPTVGFVIAEQKIRTLRRDDLEISDILLANLITEVDDGDTDPSPCDIQRGNLLISPTPVNVFPTGTQLYIYVESYNAERNANGATTLSMEVALKPRHRIGNIARQLWQSVSGAKRDEGVATRYEIGGTERDAGNYVILDLSDTAPGGYLLGVRIADTTTGQTRSSVREIEIL